MKKSIILEIHNGNAGHFEKIESSEQYRNLAGKADEVFTVLEKTFTDEQKVLFDKLHYFDIGMEAASADTHFVEGFKLGLLVGIEAMDK